jgi:hypothetical protein
VAESYAQRRLRELRIPDDQIGEPDRSQNFTRFAFNPNDVRGGGISSGITVDSGVLNPELSKRRKGERLWKRAMLRDRIDSIIINECEDLKQLD